MRKIINSPENVVEEMMEGYVGAYSKYYVKHPEVNGVILRQSRKDKVVLVVGGGSGHEPIFSGFVGKGLADAAACGNIFASPDPDTICRTAKAVDQGKGILFVYGCYAGDNLNFDMGEEYLNKEGIRTAHVRVRDDVASAPRDRYEDRRGIAGDVFVIKIAGAACDAGLELEEVVRVAQKARDCTKSIGVATAPAQLPGVKEPIFELPEGEIEYGMGLHGERGVLRTAWQEADILTERIYRQIMEDAELTAGDEVCVLVNGLGATTLMELAVVYRKVDSLLREDGIRVYDADLNSYCTSQEMGGFSITLFKLDDELKKFYDMPCYSPFYARPGTAGSEGMITFTEVDDRSLQKQLYETSAEGLPFFTPESRAGCAAYQDKRQEIQTEIEEDVSDGQDAGGYRIVRSRTGELHELCAEDARNMLIYVADKIIANRDYLTEIDSAVGDGDHGIGMAGGMKKVKKRLAAMKDTGNAYEVFEAAGEAMLLSMGGASGVIFGSLYLAGAKDMEPKAVLTAGDIAGMWRKSLKTIQERGKAQAGDKTMVDALEPAVEAMEAECGKGLLAMLRAAENAAAQGVEDTKKYRARFGRAKSLMERAVGYQDAGATSVWLIFQGMCEFAEGKLLLHGCDK